MPVIKKILYLAILLLIIFFLGVVSIFLAAFQETTLVNQIDPISAKSLNTSKKAIKHLNTKFLQNSKLLSISISDSTELLKLLSRSIPNLSARLNKINNQLFFAFTYKFPANPFGQYLNISIQLTDNKNLIYGETSVGAIKISNKLALNIMSLSLRIIFGQDTSSSISSLIRRAYFDNKNITFDMNESIDRRVLLDKIKGQLKKYQNIVLPKAQFPNTQYYYNFLLDFTQHAYGIDELSLFDIIQPLFNEAHLKSDKNSIIAAKENEDAIIALGLFLGDHQLKRLLKHLTQVIPNFNFNSKIQLAEREDLKMHFLYSSIIQILANKDISINLGEIKEISDMDKTGSGFSFADLAADRAGIRFALIATDIQGGALYLQKFLKTAKSEKSFFPDIYILPEKISQKNFLNDYKNTNSKEYRIVIKEIDRRINSLPLYESFMQSHLSLKGKTMYRVY